MFAGWAMTSQPVLQRFFAGGAGVLPAVLTGLALPGTRRWMWRALAVLTAGLTVAMLVVAFVHRPDLTDFRAVGRYVQRTTAPTDRILVWGALPDVYVAAQRDPECRGGLHRPAIGNGAAADRPGRDATLATGGYPGRDQT